MDKLYYDESGGVCHTKCPYLNNDTTHIASASCASCKKFISGNLDKQYIYCKEHIRVNRKNKLNALLSKRVLH